MWLYASKFDKYHYITLWSNAIFWLVVSSSLGLISADSPPLIALQTGLSVILPNIPPPTQVWATAFVFDFFFALSSLQVKLQ